jgi:hypothetical protein
MLGACLPVLLLAVAACPKMAKKQLYFEDLRPPLGVGKVEVIKDESMNPETGGEITVIATVEPNVDKDELTRLLESFYRQVKVRRGFQKGDKPQKIDIRCYDSKAKAEKGGDDWLARVERATSISEPSYTNRQKPPLLKWAKKALKPAMPQFSGPHKPQILADNTAMTLEITYPFVSDDGTGKYVEKLSHEKATTAFSSTTITMFEKIPQLKKFTFIGKHNDKTVMKIWLTREQFTQLDIKQVEELLGAFQGQFIEPMMSKQITAEQVHKKVLKQRRKVYRETLARLPKEQVELIKDLQ